MKSNLKNILKKEIRETFREKKSIIMMLVIPLMIPLMIFGMSSLFETEINKDVNEYNNIGFAYELSDVEKEIASNMNINIYEDNYDNISSMYNIGIIDLYLTKEQDNKYILNGNDNEITSYAIPLVESFLTSYKEYLQREVLLQNNINFDAINNIISYEYNLMSEDNFISSYIVTYAFLFIIMAITVSATYPATDATVGEKEKGTLETLLTMPISSKDIIVGKFLSVSISSAITGLLSLILTIVSLLSVNNIFDIYKDINLMLSPMTIIYAIIFIIAYSLLVSGICIAIASKSKTFKEAQSALTPLNFISFFPGMIAFMAGLKTTFVYSLIPFLNYTLLFVDIVNDNINYLYIISMLISTIIFIIILLKIIISQYKSEKVLFNS